MVKEWRVVKSWFMKAANISKFTNAQVAAP